MPFFLFGPDPGGLMTIAICSRYIVMAVSVFYLLPGDFRLSVRCKAVSV